MLRSFARILLVLVLGVGGAWLVRTQLYEGAIVESASMEPALKTGVHYMVNRWVYRTHAPQRGDLISFVNPIDADVRNIKRVIAIPGDTVELRKKQVILNGVPQDEPYAQYLRSHEALDGDTFGPLTVPDGMYFVLGDNRDVSEDSSVWRDPKTHERVYFVPLQNIKGRVVKL